MLQLSSMLLNRPVMSLRDGRSVATTTSAIINPNNLKIEGLYCRDDKSRAELILVGQDIREILPQGVVVNDYDVLAEPEELVRLHELLDINFELIGKQVVTSGGHKLGKVNDYSVETQSMFIQKLYVTQSVFRSLGTENLGISRTQIVEITDKKIVVHDATEKITADASARAVA